MQNIKWKYFNIGIVKYIKTNYIIQKGNLFFLSQVK
jgi:hypothetical protein